MKTIVRFLSLILALFLLAGLVACAEPKTPEKEPTTTPTAPENPEEPRVAHGIAEQDFDFNLNVLHYTVDGSHESYNVWNEISVENRTGDLLDDDIFERNAYLEEKFGIRVSVTYQTYTDMPGTIQKSVETGDDEYQLYDQFGFDLGYVYGRGHFLDMSTVPNINFDHPWWIQSSIDNLSIGSFVEFAASDMLLLDKGATACVFYNIPLAVDLGMNKFYDNVAENEWTIENMAGYAEAALFDLNGDDVMDGNDRYGVLCGDDPVHWLYEGAGHLFMSKDDDGYFYYEYGSPETIEDMIYIFDNMMYGEFYYNGWLHRDDAVKADFKANQALFCFGMAKACNTYRSMESDYGILPVPMLNEDQEEFHSAVSNHHDSLFAIPHTVSDQAAVGAALEVMGWYSYYDIYPDLYDTVISGKGTRDQESKEMLEIIFNSRVYDIGLIKDDPSFTDAVLRYTSTGTTNLASQFASYQTRIEKMLTDLNKLVDKYN